MYITCLLHHQDVSVTTAHLLGDSLNTLKKNTVLLHLTYIKSLTNVKMY